MPVQRPLGAVGQEEMVLHKWQEEILEASPREGMKESNPFGPLGNNSKPHWELQHLGNVDLSPADICSQVFVVVAPALTPPPTVVSSQHPQAFATPLLSSKGLLTLIFILFLFLFPFRFFSRSSKTKIETFFYRLHSLRKLQFLSSDGYPLHKIRLKNLHL